MKKMFRVLAVVAMLWGLFVVSMPAAAAATPRCTGDHDGWTTLTKGMTIESSVNYVLGAGGISGAVTVPEGVTGVTICLCGQSITSGSIALNCKGEVTLTNCKDVGGVIKSTGSGAKGSGRALQISSGGIVTMTEGVTLQGSKTCDTGVMIISGGTFNMEGGTISGCSSVEGNGDEQHGGVWVQGTFNMSGGIISGNAAGTSGGGVYMSGANGGTFNMSGGTISGNTASTGGGGVYMNGATGKNQKGTFNMSGGTIIDNTAGTAGGGVYVAAENTFTMSGTASISGNTAGTDGGGVEIAVGVSFVMQGGQITDNIADQYGGGVDLRGSMTMSGGTIANNKLTNSQPYGTQVVLRYCGDNAKTFEFNMTDGTISADSTASSNDLTVVGGMAAISGGTVTGNVGTVGVDVQTKLDISGGVITGTVSNGEIVHPGRGTHEASTITVSGGKFSDDTELAALDSWLVSDATIVTVTENGEVFYNVEALSCSGGHSGWTILNRNVASLYFYQDGRSISSSGNYYLKKDITGAVTVGSASYAINVTADNVTLCLGGYSVKPSTSGVAAIRCAGKNLRIVNCSSSGGTITGNNAVSILVEPGCSVEIGSNVSISNASITATGTNLAPVVVNEGGSFALRGGTISANTVTSTLADSYVGGAIAATNATVILETGTISGNDVTQSGTNGFGSGAVTMNGGTLNVKKQVLIQSNVTSKDGGGVALYGTDPTLIMNGGTISSNTAANGGGVYSAGNFTMKDGTISNNIAANGGGVYSAGSFSMEGGAISGNTGDQGGGVETEDAFTMSGGSITRNAADMYGGGVSVHKGTFIMSGGTISRNSSQMGAQVAVGGNDSGATGDFTMTGGTIMTKTAGNNDLAVLQGDAAIQDGSITGHVGTVGVLSGAASLDIQGGSINGQVSNATIAIPDSTTRGTCETTISGGKFSGDTERSILAGFLADNQGALSLMNITQGDLIYEVGSGFYSSGEHMAFGSSLDLGLYLNADAGVDIAQIDLADYTATVSGGYTPDLELVTENGISSLRLTAKGVAAKELRDDITFTLTDKTGDVVFTKTLSVYDAAESMYGDANASSQKRTMLADMIHYGTQAQKTFGYHNKAVLAKPDLAGKSASVTGEWEATTGDLVTNGQGSKVMMSLSLEEQIKLNFYIYGRSVTVSDVSFGDAALSEDEYSVTSDGTYTCVSFHEIPVTEVKEAAQFTVELNGSTFQVNYSIVDYVLQERDGDQSQLLKALQKYVDSVCTFLTP